MSFTRGTQLAYPFAVVGFVGGAFVGTITNEEWVVQVFALVTAFVAGCFGGIVTSRRAREPSAAAVGTNGIIIGTVAAGAVNGVLLVCGFVAFHSLIALPFAVLAGVVVGVIFCLPFMPVLAHVAHADQGVGAARPTSLVDGAHRRGPWAVCFGWIGASSLVALFSRWSARHIDAVLLMAALALAGIALVFVADVRAWRGLRRRAEGQDVGIGPLEWIEHPPAGYRAPPTTSLVLRDDTLARAEIERALRRDVLAFVFACAGIALFVFGAYARTLPFPL